MPVSHLLNACEALEDWLGVGVTVRWDVGLTILTSS